MLATWWTFAAEVAWKGTLLLAGASAVSVLLWRASATLRHLVWALALGGLLLLPVFLGLLPNWGAVRIYVPAAPEVPVASTRVSVPAHPKTAPLERLPTAVFGIWLTGAFVCFWRWKRGTAKVALMRTDAVIVSGHDAVIQEAAAQVGLNRRVQLLKNSREIVPWATGVRRPVVVLPASSSEWSRERFRIVLLHELAHIQRRDSLTQALAELALCLYWFHPLVWLALRRLRVERERACDDLVLRAGTGASDYASHLLGLARSLQPAELSPAAVSMAGAHLETRIRAILNPRTNRRVMGRASAVMACVIAACLVLPLAAMRPQATAVGLVSGTVYDPAGARVPDASVIAMRPDNGQKMTTTTDQEGKFSIGPLPEGLWQITIEARGFAPLTIEKIPSSHFEVLLKIGEMRETVVVRGKGTPAVNAWLLPQRVRVGGNMVPAKLVSKVDPEYPADAQSHGIYGNVVLRAVVSIQGAVLSPTIISSPDPQLAEAAIKAVGQWRYQPSLLNGEPVETATTITVNFELEP